LGEKYNTVYGKRTKLGLIVPASNTVCEPEMAGMAPAGVNTYATRILFCPTIEDLKAMKHRVQKAARELSCESIVDLIAFCCTVGSLIDGPRGESEIISCIETEACVPAITTAAAVMAAFDALHVRRIAVATPYTREINSHERNALERAGYEITAMAGYHEDVAPDMFNNRMIGNLPSKAAFELALKVDGPDNEAIFISCTNFRSIDVLEELESVTGKPIITSNQATMWFALRSLGLKDAVKGHGRLFEM
jgi:maleate isomerase